MIELCKRREKGRFRLPRRGPRRDQEMIRRVEQHPTGFYLGIAQRIPVFAVNVFLDERSQPSKRIPPAHSSNSAKKSSNSSVPPLFLEPWFPDAAYSCSRSPISSSKDNDGC
ncbi:hypothetical protein D3C74_235680 [compost metagenome]